jgi:hypothetical protein
VPPPMFPARARRRRAAASSSVLASQMVQVSTEAKTRPSITALTMMSADMNMPQGVKSRGRSAGVISVDGGTEARAPCAEISSGTTGGMDGAAAAGAGAAGAATEAAGAAVAGGAEGCGAGWACPPTEPHIIAKPTTPLRNERAIERTEPVMRTSCAATAGIIDHEN